MNGAELVDADQPPAPRSPLLPIDHSRIARNRKTRPNDQRDAQLQHIIEQLQLADNNRTDAVRTAKAEHRITMAVDNAEADPQTAVHADLPSPEEITQSTTPIYSTSAIQLFAGAVPCSLCQPQPDPPARNGPQVSTAASALGPRDLSRCPVYTRDTDDLSRLSTLPSCLFAQIYLNGSPVAAVVDSGALVTLLHGTVYDDLPDDLRPALSPSHLHFASATGATDFAVRGVAVMGISIAGTVGQVLVTVCDKLHVQCLLGDDYMLRYGVTPCRLDLCVRSRKGHTPYRLLYRDSLAPSVCAAMAHQQSQPALSLPALSTTCCYLPVPADASDGQRVLLEPSPAAMSLGVSVDRTMVIVTNRLVPVRITNHSDVLKQLGDHDVVALLYTEFEALPSNLPPLLAYAYPSGTGGLSPPRSMVSMALLPPNDSNTSHVDTRPSPSAAPAPPVSSLSCDAGGLSPPRFIANMASLTMPDSDPSHVILQPSPSAAPVSLVSVSSGDTLMPIPAPSVTAGGAGPTLAGTVQSIYEQLPLADSVYAEGSPRHPAFLQFLNDHLPCFATHGDDYGRTSILQHHIHTEPHAAPVYQRPRPVPLRTRDAVRTEINSMLAAGIVVPSSSEWSSPIVVVKKKDGGIRLCVDYRAVNDITIKDSFPLPRIDDLLESLYGAAFFASMDLQKGFHQIEMAPDSCCKTAFAVPWGLYEYRVMPFGVCNGPSTFQRLVTLALGETLFTDCLAYIDDILVYASDPNELMAKMRRVFAKLAAAGLKVKPQKCHFGVSSVDFLGHHVSIAGTRPLAAKLATIVSSSRPTSPTELRAFLGLTNYYRDYIVDYSSLAAPMYDLLRKNVTWSWGPRQEAALEHLHAAFRQAPILAHPNATDTFILDTDASLDGIGGVLGQIQEGVERVVCCGSRILTPAERNYDTTRRELLAIVFFCKHFRHYLYGAPFALRTDHAALRWLLQSADSTGQNMRWITTLADYPMLIFHRPGHLHANADALSRLPLLLADGILTTFSTSRVPIPIATVLARYGPTAEDATLDQLLVQRSDPILASVITAVTNHSWPTLRLLPTYSPDFRAYHARRIQLELHGDVLYLKSFHRDRSPVNLLVVPAAGRSAVIAECHDATSAAHFAERKTAHSVRQRFWWPTLREDVCLYCRLCATCQLCTKRPVPGHAPMHTYHAGTLWEVLGMDFIGPMAPTSRRNRYILTMVDHFSRLTVLVPTKVQTAEATAAAVVNHWLTYYGMPRIIHTDRGTNFVSVVMASLCARLGVRRTMTTAYRPQADGRVERTNRTVKECITRLLHEHATGWDLLLPHVAMAINSTVHESTGFTPFYLAHGCEMQLPVDLVAALACPAPSTTPPYVDELLRRFNIAYQLARATMLKQANRSKRRYDASARTIFYAVGDKVFYRKKHPDPIDHAKFYAQWSGPCTVTEVLSDVNLRITHDTQDWSRVVHVDTVYKRPSDYDTDEAEPASSPMSSTSSSDTEPSLPLEPQQAINAPDTRPTALVLTTPTSSTVPIIRGGPSRPGPRASAARFVVHTMLPQLAAPPGTNVDHAARVTLSPAAADSPDGHPDQTATDYADNAATLATTSDPPGAPHGPASAAPPADHRQSRTPADTVGHTPASSP